MTDMAPLTSDEFDVLMSHLVGVMKKGQDKARYTDYVTEVRRMYGHRPGAVLRKAVALMLVGTNELPYTGDAWWGMWMREAERQVATLNRLDAGLLPLDETRREREERERYEAAYGNVGPGTDAFEWAMCLGIAKQRKRRRLLAASDIDIDTTTAFRSPQEKEDFGPGLDEPVQDEIQAIYDERRRENVPIGRNPGATSEYWSRHGGGWKTAGDTIRSRGWDKDPRKFVKDVGGFKSSREILEERRRDGRLEPQMEEYLLERIAEEERDAPAPGADRPSGEPPPV